VEDTQDTTQGQRLKQLLSHFKMKQIALSQRLGIGKAYISQMINDQSPITSKVISGLIKSFPRLNSNWLLTGNGQMFLEDEIGTTDQIEQGRPRTLEDLEAENGDDPFRGLRDMLHRIDNLERRMEELEQKLSQIVN
jgi:plasmid maintenance system antidote protein VapI